MNYLAHLYFAQPSAESLTGNLMGDFTKGVDLSTLPIPIQMGIENHRLIDKYTDHHLDVKSLKSFISPPRKRFSAIIADVMFDHFLALHWQQFSQEPFEQFIATTYEQLSRSIELMPDRMQVMVTKMIEQNWLGSYVNLESTGQAIDGISRRIRFDNELTGAIDEVKNHYGEYETVFFSFFPQLLEHVNFMSIEKPDC